MVFLDTTIYVWVHAYAPTSCPMSNRVSTVHEMGNLYEQAQDYPFVLLEQRETPVFWHMLTFQVLLLVAPYHETISGNSHTNSLVRLPVVRSEERRVGKA